MRIGFQGDNYSNSYFAAMQYANQNKEEFEAVPLINSYPVIQALINGEIEIGVVAHRNSIAGLVNETEIAMNELGSSVEEIEEITLPIHHCLFTISEKAEDIKYIYSHEQALRQCEDYIKTHYPNAEAIKEKDTSLAALKLASGEYDRNVAVICNKACGNHYKLKLIRENIEAEQNNHTTFKVYRKRFMNS